MEFAWDETKSANNARVRGFGFDHAALIFRGPTLNTHDNRRAYGEVRIHAIGAIDTDVLVVVYTDRNSVRRIISARKANRKERQKWHLFVNL